MSVTGKVPSNPGVESVSVDAQAAAHDSGHATTAHHEVYAKISKKELGKIVASTKLRQSIGTQAYIPHMIIDGHEET